MDVAALESRARPLLVNEAAYHYYAGGSDDEVTLGANIAAWRDLRFLPHVLRDVSTVSTDIELLGARLATPILIAPMAAQKLAHPTGEVGMAGAAAAHGTIMVVSTMATISLEDVATGVPDSMRWFQCYVHRDRELSADLVRRAEAAGYSAVVLTVDVPVLSRRRRDEIHRFALPEGLQMENVKAAHDATDGSALAEYADSAFDPALTLDDIAWIRSITDLPVIVKGVLRPDDATEIVAAGAAALIVSNHGGRQLDGAIASAHALPAVVDAVGTQIPVLVDGGIQGGYDVAKALCLGAQAVLLGRPMLWGLATGGTDGAAAVLEEFTSELERTLALLGVTSVADLDPTLIC